MKNYIRLRRGVVGPVCDNRKQCLQLQRALNYTGASWSNKNWNDVMLCDESPFYCTKMTHDSGSTEDRERDIITPCIQRIDGSHTSVSDQQTDHVDAKTYRHTDWRMCTHTSVKPSCLETGNRKMQECFILCLFLTTLSITRTWNLVRALKTYKSILCRNLNKIHPLLVFILFFFYI